MTSGVYCIRNSENGKRYIGSSKNMETRIKHHFQALRKGTHSNLHLQRAFELHGEEAFAWEIIETCLPVRDTILKLEQKYLDKVSEQDYNQNHIADGVEMTDEVRNKISESHKDREYPTGWKHSEEAKKKMSEAQIGNKKHLGHRHSQEAKSKMREAWKKRKNGK